MNRREMERDMKQSIGAYPTITKLASYMGWGRNRTREFCKGLPKVGTQFFYKDIVEELLRKEKG